MICIHVYIRMYYSDTAMKYLFEISVYFKFLITHKKEMHEPSKSSLYVFGCKITLWLERWFLSSNAKDIGVLYLIFALVSGLIGTAFSVLIRLELSGPGVQFIQDNQLYNSIITAHAIVMIFFMVMPAMIGGFGKITYDIKRYINVNNNKSNVNQSTLGPYLAGLIEADGSFAVHDKNSKAKPYNPKILVVFSLPDRPLAVKLQSITDAGTIQIRANANYVIWHIQTINDVIKIINIINGYMRTPKIEALHRAIDWINERLHSVISKKDLDLSPIDSNSWLAGFTDGDGNFSLNLTNRKKAGKTTSKRVQAFFRIELRQNYHRKSDLQHVGTSYFNILNKIATYLDVALYNRTREQKDKLFFSFMVISHNVRSHEKTMRYFDNYPLYSSKYLAYKDWSHVVNKIIARNKRPLTLEDIDEIGIIKNQFNSKPTSFDFKHLDTLI